MKSSHIFQISLIVFLCVVVLSGAILFSNYLISTRPIYVQNNGGVNGVSTNNINVSATGKVSVKPDIVTFTAGYKTKKPDVASLQKDLTDKNNAIIDALKSEGIEEKDIKTISFQMSPSYRYDYTSGKSYDDGQQGSVLISVNVRNIADAGKVMDKAVKFGANNISDVTFTLDNFEKARESAREIATKMAKEKAQQLAENSGVSLGGLISINEGSSSSSPIYYNRYENGYVADAAAAPTASTTLSSGSLEVSITVNATYGIR